LPRLYGIARDHDAGRGFLYFLPKARQAAGTIKPFLPVVNRTFVIEKQLRWS
jgi:hypothetical protein